MKWRVLSVETGEEMSAPEGYEFLLQEDGSLVSRHEECTDFYKPKGIIVEFAFRKDKNSEWDYSHAVMHE